MSLREQVGNNNIPYTGTEMVQDQVCLSVLESKRATHAGVLLLALLVGLWALLQRPLDTGVQAVTDDMDELC